MNMHSVRLLQQPINRFTASTRPRATRIPQQQSTSAENSVTAVNVRLRQQDAGVLYQNRTELSTDSLATYQAGEMLDFYV